MFLSDFISLQQYPHQKSTTSFIQQMLLVSNNKADIASLMQLTAARLRRPVWRYRICKLTVASFYVSNNFLCLLGVMLPVLRQSLEKIEMYFM